MTDWKPNSNKKWNNNQYQDWNKGNAKKAWNADDPTKKWLSKEDWIQEQIRKSKTKKDVKKWEGAKKIAKNRVKFRKEPLPLAAIAASAFLKRHGIERQVTSSLIVNEANAQLKSVLDLYAQPAVRAVSFRNFELFIDCRHPAAVHAVHPFTDGLKEHLESAFGSITISKVTCRFSPQSFDDL